MIFSATLMCLAGAFFIGTGVTGGSDIHIGFGVLAFGQGLIIGAVSEAVKAIRASNRKERGDA